MPEPISFEETQVFEPYFKQADPSGSGYVSGELASTFFIQSGLQPLVLGQIWQLVDPNNKGYLDKQGFFLALRIIGHVQAGAALSPALADTPGSLPFFNSSTQQQQQTSSPQATKSVPSMNPSNTGPIPPQFSGMASIPPLSPQERESYRQMFIKSAPSGYLEGSDARNIFIKSRLTNETLVQVWNLADPTNRGKLNEPEFIFAMHVIRCVLVKSIPKVPSQLPPGYLESFFQPSSASASNSASAPSTARSGMQANRTGPIPSSQPASAPSVSNEWVISSQERAQSDKLFDSLDKAHRGTIGADEVVPFLTKSNLSEDVLAQVWDLADVKNTGIFSKLEFSIAMYLVHQKLAGRDLPSNLPQSLLQSPSNTAPLSFDDKGNQSQMNTNSNNTFGNTVPMQGTGSGFQAPLVPPKIPQSSGSFNQNSSLLDLVTLSDDFSSSSPAQNTQPINKNLSFGQGQNSAFGSIPAQHTPTSAPSLNPSMAGVTAASSSLSQPDELDNKVSTVKTDVANLQNQVNSMSSQAQNASDKRQRTEAELNRLAGVRSDLQTQLNTFRTNRDQDVKKHEELEQILHQNQLETGKLSQEYSTIQAQYGETHNKLQELTTKYNAEREENAKVKQQIKQTNEETTALKAQLESVSKEAKQQHNILTISKQQLLAAEQERDSYKTQIEALQTQIRGIQEEVTLNNQKLEEAKQQLLQNQSTQQQLQAQQRALETHRAQQEAHQASLPHFPSSNNNTGTAAGVAGAAALAAGAVVGSMAHTASSSTTNVAPNSPHPTGNTIIGSPSTISSVPLASSNTSNPFYHFQAPTSAESQQSLNNAAPAPSASFSDQFGQRGVFTPAASVTDNTTATNESIYNTMASTSTANTSPNSEFTNNGGMINGFQLPLSRPHSITSSVQNNAPMSVRGDFDANVSRPESPIDSDEAQAPSSPVTSEHVAGMAPPEDLEIHAIATNGLPTPTGTDTQVSIPISVAATAGSSIPDSNSSIDGSASGSVSDSVTGFHSHIPDSLGPVAISSSEFSEDQQHDRLSSSAESYEMVPGADELTLSLSRPEDNESVTAPVSSNVGSAIPPPFVSFPSGEDSEETTKKNPPLFSAGSKDSTSMGPSSGFSPSSNTFGLPGSLPAAVSKDSSATNIVGGGHDNDDDSSSDDEGPEVLPGQSGGAPLFYQRTGFSSNDPFGTGAMPPASSSGSTSVPSSAPASASIDTPSAYSTAPAEAPLKQSSTDNALFASTTTAPAASLPAPVSASTKADTANKDLSDFDDIFNLSQPQVLPDFQTSHTKPSLPLAADITPAAQPSPSAFAPSSQVPGQAKDARSDSTVSVSHFADPQNVSAVTPELPPKKTISSSDPFAVPQQRQQQPSQSQQNQFSFADSAFPSASSPFPNADAGFPKDSDNPFPNSFVNDSFPTDNSQETAPKPSNDEWESLFASFSAPNGATATGPAATAPNEGATSNVGGGFPSAVTAPVSQKEIEDAFNFNPAPPAASALSGPPVPPAPSSSHAFSGHGVSNSTGGLRGPQPPIPPPPSYQQQQQQSLQQQQQIRPGQYQDQFQTQRPAQYSQAPQLSQPQDSLRAQLTGSRAPVASQGTGSGQLRSPMASQGTGSRFSENSSSYNTHHSPSSLQQQQQRDSSSIRPASRTGTFSSQASDASPSSSHQASNNSPGSGNNNSSSNNTKKKNKKNSLSFMHSHSSSKDSKDGEKRRTSIVPNLSLGFGKSSHSDKKGHGVGSGSSAAHEADLQQLTSMGFSRERAVKALEKNKYNVESAINYLLEKS